MSLEQIKPQSVHERISDSVLISEIPPIDKGGISTNVESLDQLVEPPLLEACEELQAKNIKSVMSSANQTNIGDLVYIDIDFDSLSEENKKIAQELGEVFTMRGSIPSKCVKITFPIMADTTVGDVRRISHEAVSRFEHQSKQETEKEILKYLIISGATILREEKSSEEAYKVTFNFGEVTTTVRIKLADRSGAGLVISNMTTFPESARGEGFGSSVVKILLSSAIGGNIEDIRVVQVEENSESFWIKNGFVKIEGDNPTNDFVFKVINQ